jgi:hypothetical protein
LPGTSSSPIFTLTRCTLLLDGLAPKVPATFIGKVARSQCVAKEVEAFTPGILDRGFRLVERQPELRHHRPRPGRSLFRVSAAEDDEVVGIGDDMCVEHFAAPRQPPMLQESVHGR